MKYLNLILGTFLFVLQIKYMLELSRVDWIDSVFSGIIYLSFFIFGYNILKYSDDFSSLKNFSIIKFIKWLIKYAIFVNLWIFLIVFIKLGIFVVPFTYFGDEMIYIYTSSLWGIITSEFIQRHLRQRRGGEKK